MTACLDTNVLVDILNDRRPVVRRRYESELGSERKIVVSSLAAHELMFGALISPKPDLHAELVRRLLSDHDVAEWTPSDAYAVARLRAQLRREGRTIGSFDALMAGQALNRGWTLVTANTREFSRIEGLAIEDWSRPAA